MEFSRIMVLGGGTSSYSAAKLARKKNILVDVFVNRSELSSELIKRYNQIGANIHLFENLNLSTLNIYSYIIRSPGIKFEDPILKNIRRYHGNLISEIEFGYLFARSAKYIAITGSNGKTTVATILFHILKNRKRKVFLAGNIGIPLTEIADELDDNSIVILELSSFQLENIELLKPFISIILNLSPNHLDAVSNLEFYYNSKMNILKNSNWEDYFVFNGDCQEIIKRIPEKPLKIINVGNKKFSNFRYDEVGIINDKKYLYKFKKSRLKGKHNHFNLTICYAVSTMLGLNNSLIKRRLNSFKGLEYRIELVARINSVDYYNDSKSTTPESTIAAINAINNANIYLILGGRNKNLDFNIIKNSNIAKIYAYGESKFEIQKCLNNVEIFNNIEEVMQKVFMDVEPGSAVLFSPSCTSHDQYDNYIERGSHFNKIIKEYSNEIAKEIKQ